MQDCGERRFGSDAPHNPARLASYAKLLSSYRFDDAEGGTRITIEIRVTDPAERTAARRFRWYWPLVGRWGAAVFGRALLRAARRHTRRAD